MSRTLVKAQGGTVTAFAFDTGEALSEHSAPFDALVLGVEGEAEVSISEHGHTASRVRRDPPPRERAARAAKASLTPFKMILVMVKA